MESVACDTFPGVLNSPENLTVLIECYTSRRFPGIRLDPRTESKRPDGNAQSLYEVRVIDNDVNTYQEVIEISMAALGVTLEEAYAIAWEVDHRGHCVVAVGPLDVAEAVAAMIRTIGIDVHVNPVGAWMSE
jgi:ATP-dependent Clp protease adapter protein ClpS